MDCADRIVDVVIPLVVILGILGVTVSGIMLIMQPREVVSDVHQCSSTSRVVRVSAGPNEHHAVQVWGGVWRVAAYTGPRRPMRRGSRRWCIATQERRPWRSLRGVSLGIERRLRLIWMERRDEQKFAQR